MSLVDWLICAAALGLMFAPGWWFARRQKTTEDYFVGGRRMGWIAVGLSLFTASFSPLSFVGLPREAAYADYHLFLAILFIPLFVMPVVAWLFVPLYHRLQPTSAYEYLERRFDRRLRLAGSLLFGLYTLGWLGNMLYATGLIVQAALDLDHRTMVAVIIGLGAFTTIYTTLGGFQASVWTGVVKAAILAGVIFTILFLAVSRVDGGIVSVFRLGWEHDKFRMFDVHTDLTRRASFGTACAYGLFVYLSVYVAGQSSVQRYVSMPSVAAARRSLAINACGVAGMCWMFFLLGTTLFAFYAQNPAGNPGAGTIFPTLPKQDQITTHFVRTELPYAGLLGLLVAGLLATVMGSISGGLNSLSALVACDWRKGRPLGVAASRRLTVLFGVVAVGTALVVPSLGEHVFDILMKIAGAFFGPLLALFLLGTLMPRANAPGAMLGLIAGFISLAVVFPTNVAAAYYGAFTFLPTFLVGVLGSLIFPPPPAEKVLGLLVHPSRPVTFPNYQLAEQKS